MGGLLKSVRSSHPPSLAVPNASHEQHMTVTQVSRDFSSVSSAGHEGGDLLVFLVGKEFALLVAGSFSDYPEEGLFLENLGGVVWHTYLNPYSFSYQNNNDFPTSYFRPE